MPTALGGPSSQGNGHLYAPDGPLGGAHEPHRSLITYRLSKNARA